MQGSFRLGDGLDLTKRLGLVIVVVVATNAASFVYKQLYREQSFLSLVCLLQICRHHGMSQERR
jgi:hypothetical protein